MWPAWQAVCVIIGESGAGDPGAERAHRTEDKGQLGLHTPQGM